MSTITRFDLEGHNRFSHRSGFYVGDAGKFEDIVNFWNLRAANLGVLFFDPAHEARFKALRDSYVKILEENGEHLSEPIPPVWVWSAKKDPGIYAKDFGKKGVNFPATIAHFLPTVDFP